jgi:ABC-type sugar transport system substrate-binding protein
MAAAQAIGWKVTILDGKLEPSTYGGLVDQAIADGANGIILDAVDCNRGEGAPGAGQGQAHRGGSHLRL